MPEIAKYFHSFKFTFLAIKAEQAIMKKNVNFTYIFFNFHAKSKYFSIIIIHIKLTLIFRNLSNMNFGIK